MEKIENFDEVIKVINIIKLIEKIKENEKKIQSR